ncbi:MAG TPA: hypothetical protein VFY04_12175 [Solirubrobacterales bacterium]|nr:hypothetical protein [Solirubrobacterales bacterium]
MRRISKIVVSFATSSGRGFEREAAEAVAQVVEATHAHPGRFLGADKAGPDGGAVEGHCPADRRRSVSSENFECV